LKAYDKVSSLSLEPKVEMPKPVALPPVLFPAAEFQWNMQQILAPEVWENSQDFITRSNEKWFIKTNKIISG